MVFKKRLLSSEFISTVFIAKDIFGILMYVNECISYPCCGLGLGVEEGIERIER